MDKTWKDVCYINNPFGGKLIILGGDFRQILPVVKNGFRNRIIEESIIHSLLLNIGEGKIDELIIPNECKSIDVCRKIYKNINNNYDFSNNVILTSHNEEVNILNNKILIYILMNR